MSFLENLKHRYWSILPYDYRPKQIWYVLKCFLWKRYTTVKPRWLGHTWHDRGDLMPYVMFELLCQFLEKECSPGHVEWYGDNGHKIIPGKPWNYDEVYSSPDAVYVMDEMLALRDWWINDYLVNHNNCYDEWHNHIEKKYGEYSFDLQIDDEDQKIFDKCTELEHKYDHDLIVNMQRLVCVTPSMWT